MEVFALLLGDGRVRSRALRAMPTLAAKYAAKMGHPVGLLLTDLLTC